MAKHRQTKIAQGIDTCLYGKHVSGLAQSEKGTAVQEDVAVWCTAMIGAMKECFDINVGAELNEYVPTAAIDKFIADRPWLAFRSNATEVLVAFLKHTGIDETPSGFANAFRGTNTGDVFYLITVVQDHIKTLTELAFNANNDPAAWMQAYVKYATLLSGTEYSVELLPEFFCKEDMASVGSIMFVEQRRYKHFVQIVNEAHKTFDMKPMSDFVEFQVAVLMSTPEIARRYARHQQASASADGQLINQIGSFDDALPKSIFNDPFFNQEITMNMSNETKTALEANIENALKETFTIDSSNDNGKKSMSEVTRVMDGVFDKTLAGANLTHRKLESVKCENPPSFVKQLALGAAQGFAIGATTATGSILAIVAVNYVYNRFFGGADEEPTANE